MTLNISKCAHMVITRKQNPLICTYKINYIDTKQVEEFTYLEITIDSKMSYNAYVQYVSSAATKNL